jgi:hypothetical protein
MNFFVKTLNVGLKCQDIHTKLIIFMPKKIVYNISYKYNLKTLSSSFYPFETTCVLQTHLFKNKMKFH